MASVTAGNLSDEGHRALRVRAALNGRSTGAEIRDILETAVRPPERVRLGTLLAEIGKDAGLMDEDCAVFATVRGATPGEPASFE